MNSWSNIALSRDNGHQRSVSIGGWSGVMNSDLVMEDPTTLGNPFGNQPINQSHASYVDLNRIGDKYSDSRRLFSWRSPGNKSERHKNRDRNLNSTDQRPFETAFKAAISKMKESSISRLGIVDRNDRNNLFESKKKKENVEDAYRRNCMTLQPRKISVDSRVPRPSNKIFKCNSTADRGSGGVSSVKPNPIDCPSERESDKNYKENQYRSVTNLSSDPVYYQDNYTNREYASMPRKDFSNGDTMSSSASKIVIPIKSNPYSAEVSRKTSVVYEAHISPKVAVKAHSALPNMDRLSMDIKEDAELESLPSVRDTITKLKTMTDSNTNHIMSKSLTLTSDKPPMKALQRTESQRIVDGNKNPYPNEQLTVPGKRMSGLYKKSNPTPVKGKTVINMPVDFQKLHSAFLDQKQEIKNLKQELEEKMTYINQLESDIRSYEPWR